MSNWPFGNLQQFKYGAILVDPPWRMKMYSVKGMGRSPDGPVTRGEQRQNNPERHYATMPLDEIKALPVGDLAATDCVLFMWAIDPMLPQALEVGAAWGFTYKTIAFYWAKERRITSERHKLHTDEDHKRFPIGTGYWTRSNPEQCLLFTCGSPKRLSAAVRKLIIEPRREHSRKPDRLKSDIERLIAGPYAELFSRESRQGWDCWGNQSDQFSIAKGKPDAAPKVPLVSARADSQLRQDASDAGSLAGTEIAGRLANGAMLPAMQQDQGCDDSGGMAEIPQSSSAMVAELRSKLRFVVQTRISEGDVK